MTRFSASAIFSLGLLLFSHAGIADELAPVLIADPVGDAVIQIRQNFERDIKPLVQRACMACHDSQAKPEGFVGHIPGIRCVEWHHIHDASRILDFRQSFPNWSTQNDDPLFFISQIKKVIEKDSMPLESFRIFHELDGRLLKAPEKQTILTWAEQSTQLLAAADASRPTASKIFSARCLGCHNEDDNNGGLIFQKVDGKITPPSGKTHNGIPFLSPNDPENSAIFLVLQSDPTLRKGLKQMPDGDTISEPEKLFIYNWIKSN
jgi:hypothetical protein